MHLLWYTYGFLTVTKKLSAFEKHVFLHFFKNQQLISIIAELSRCVFSFSEFSPQIFALPFQVDCSLLGVFTSQKLGFEPKTKYGLVFFRKTFFLNIKKILTKVNIKLFSIKKFKILGTPILTRRTKVMISHFYFKQRRFFYRSLLGLKFQGVRVFLRFRKRRKPFRDYWSLKYYKKRKIFRNQYFKKRFVLFDSKFFFYLLTKQRRKIFLAIKKKRFVKNSRAPGLNATFLSILKRFGAKFFAVRLLRSYKKRILRKYRRKTWIVTKLWQHRYFLHLTSFRLVRLLKEQNTFSVTPQNLKQYASFRFGFMWTLRFLERNSFSGLFFEPLNPVFFYLYYTNRIFWLKLVEDLYAFSRRHDNALRY